MLEKEINKDVENLEYNFNNYHKSSKKFNFSIIMAIYNAEKFLEEAIESVINQTIGFKDNVELILVDDGSEDESREICLKYVNKFPENIKYFYQENQGQATARNNGMKVANAKYLNFLDSDDKLEKNALELVYNFFKENLHKVDIVSIPIKFFDRQTGDHILNYKYKTTRVVDLINEPDYIQLSASASFFKKESIENFIFDPDLIVSEDAIFLNRILLKKKKLGVVSNTCYFYRKRFTNDSTIDSSVKDKDYYLQRSQIFFKELFEYCRKEYGEIFDFIKYTVMYDIQWIFEIRNIEEILETNDLITLKRYLYDLLQEIDDEIILNQKYYDKNLKYTILIFKHENLETEVLEEENNVKKIVNETVIDELYYHRLYIDAFEIHENKLTILGFLKSYFIYPEINIQAIQYNPIEFLEYWEKFFNENKILFIKRDFLNNKGLLLQDALLNKIDKNDENLKKLLGIGSESEIKFCDFIKEKNEEIKDIDNYWKTEHINQKINSNIFQNKAFYNSIYNETLKKFIEEKANIINCEKIEYPYRERKYLDLNYTPNFNFELKINLNKKEKSKILIRVVYDSLNFYLDITLTNNCKLTNDSFYSLKDDYLIKFQENTFEIFEYSLNQHLELEESNINYLESKKNLTLNEVIRFRKHFYYSFFKYFNRRIWLFMDRIDKADDNAEHLFKYAVKQNDGIEKYFVISENSKDYPRIKKIGNVIVAGSEEHKLLSCFAEKVISSQADDSVLNPFFGKNQKYLNGLFSAKIYFLQHGVTKDDVSSWLHKYDKYLYLIVTTAKAEYDSFFNENAYYNYEKSIIQLLGFPRHDNLKKLEDKKEIVIMPSWRRSLHNINDLTFKKSEYFKVYNKLLNDAQLIDFLKNKGYKLVFKPHPNIMKYLHLFDKEESVIFAESKVGDEDLFTYNKIFNHSSMLITDFSSVSFDFALLKKPIIYYQYDNDYHFDIEKGYFNYETMGFGEVVKNHQDLVDLIIDYVNKNCDMKEEFKERVDSFFEFNDKNNCKRVYDFILNN